MSPAFVRFRSLAVVGVLVAAHAACSDEPFDTPSPATESEVLLDVSGELEAVGYVIDTLEVQVPYGRYMGVIMETNAPIVMRYGSGRGQLVYSGSAATSAAIVEHAVGELRLLVGRSEPEVVPVDYRIRILAIDDRPEHVDFRVEPGDGFRTERIEPALDLDVFTFDLEDGQQVALEFESLDENVRFTARVNPRGGAGRYLFLEAGPELALSPVYEAATSGRHELLVYSAGLRPDVTAEYRFRIVEAD